MAEIKSIDVQDTKIEVKLLITMEEYRILRHQTADLVVLPCGNDSLPHNLTTGKLGNSNRIMMPKKLMELFSISELDKKVPANIFNLGGDSFLLLKIKKSGVGIPKFGEGF